MTMPDCVDILRHAQRHASGQNLRLAWKLPNLKSLCAQDRICMLNIKKFN